MPPEPLSLARARSYLGTRFRLHGRDQASGLDCVGLVAAAHGIGDVPSGYPLRWADRAAITVILDRLAMRRDGPAGVGDIVLIRPGRAQLHLGLWTGNSMIHAHAGLRRVVETPGAIADHVIGVWCIPEQRS